MIGLKYGFLFGAGAEIAYKLPSGGRFALNIFRQDTTNAKENFKRMRENVDSTTTYANHWLPRDYMSNSIHTFGKTVFQNIIMSTVEHRRNQIVDRVNDLDVTAIEVVHRMQAEGIDVDQAFYDLLGRDIHNLQLSNDIAYNELLKEGNKLFANNYFSGLISIYRDKREEPNRHLLKKMILAIMQLQLGALSENLSRSVSDNLFLKKDENIDLFDDFGDLIQLNYNAAGVSGLEFLLEKPVIEVVGPYEVVLKFALRLTEELYASVLDYKSLIDSNWHYLYSPSSDWAKFCKISIFLLTVHQYIAELGNEADKNNPDGYYNMLRTALDGGRFDVSAIATTNYNKIIEEVLGAEYPVTYLNGSVAVWYDPYLNKVGSVSELDNSEHHIIVPLLFTQSGTKPMTSISMSVKYVELYNNWKDSDAIVVVGFGFGSDDEHINGILRTLVNDDGKKLIIVGLENDKSEDREAQEVARKLKITNYKNIEMLLVDKNGVIKDRPWTEMLK